MAEIALQPITAMTAPRWKPYLRDIVCVAPTVAAVDIFINATSFNLPDTIRLTNEKGWMQVDKKLARGNPPFHIPFNALDFLIAASVAIKYYDTCGYIITLENMQRDIVLAIYETVKNLEERKKDTTSKKLTKLVGNNSLPFWLPKAMAELDSMIGTWGIPLSYLIREDIVAPADDRLIQGEAFSQENGSITDELIRRATHDHHLMKEENRMLFEKLFDSFRGSEVETTITSEMKQHRQGRALWMAACTEWAGDDSWNAIIAKNRDVYENAKFTGTGVVYSLWKHVSRMQVAFSQLQLANEQPGVSVTIPNDQTKVRYLLKSIECDDVGLKSRMEIVRSSKAMKNNFDQTAQYLQEADPVFRRSIQQGGSNNSGKSTKNATASQLNLKQGVGSTGVEFCWYPREEYQALSKEQKDELGTWMKNTDEGKKCSSDHRKEWKKGKKGAAKYGKKRNISKAEFAGVKKTKQYKADLKKVLAKSMKDEDEGSDKASDIASILQSEIQRQVKATNGGKQATAPRVASSKIEF